MFALLRRHLSYANVMATIAVFIALGGGAIAAKSLTSGDGTITGCVARKSGAVKVVAAGRKCPKGTTTLTWSQAGKPGERGAAGEQGSQGPPGTPGAPGSALAYAHVRFDGTLDVANSKGVSVRKECVLPCSSVSEGSGNYQCLHVEAPVKNAVVTTQILSSIASARVEIPAPKANPIELGCPPGFDDVRVLTFNTTNGSGTPAGFYILFN